MQQHQHNSSQHQQQYTSGNTAGASATFHIHIPLFINFVVTAPHQHAQPSMPQAPASASYNTASQTNTASTQQTTTSSSSPQPNSNNGFNNAYFQQQQQHFFNTILLPYLISQGAATVTNNNTYNFNGFNYQQMVNDILQQSFMQHQQQANKQGPPAAKREFIEKLPVFKLTPKHALLLNQLIASSNTSTNGQEINKAPITCAVCQCECECNSNDELLIQLPCQHVYHKECCMPWIEKHNTCPTCRYEMPVEDSKEESQRVKRMEQRYSPEGLKIMDLQMQVHKLYIQFSELQEQGIQLQQHETRIKGIDNQLTILSMQLDALGELTGKPKEQRRQVLKMIQAIQHEIDTTTQSQNHNRGEDVEMTM